VLSGKVIDVHTGYPVAGVRLGCLRPGTVHNCRSDATGGFSFTDINEGCWQVKANKPPYAEHISTQCVEGNLQIHICLLIEGLEDGVVTA
jgi:hypothetical protein